MATKRAIARVLGVVRQDTLGELLPMIPLMAQFNVEDDDGVLPGDELEIRVRVWVQQIVPTPIPESGPAV